MHENQIERKIQSHAVLIRQIDLKANAKWKWEIYSMSTYLLLSAQKNCVAKIFQFEREKSSVNAVVVVVLFVRATVCMSAM